MSTRKTRNNSSEKWFEKPLNLIITFVGVVTSTFVGGYYVGNFKKELEQQVISIKQLQDCNERVNSEKEKCAEYRRLVETEKMEDLRRTVSELKNLKNKGTNEK